MKSMKVNRLFKKAGVLLGMLMMLVSLPAQAHCDSYDGPVIQDALRALEQDDVSLVMKWIEPQYEAEISNLFTKTVSLKDQDQEVYDIVEKHFLETLVRLHREGEGAPFTGLKPAGSATPLVQMADASIAQNDLTGLLTKLTDHLQKDLSDKYQKVMDLHKVKDQSVEQGRAYVAAYVDYTHTLEGIEHILAHGGHH